MGEEAHSQSTLRPPPRMGGWTVRFGINGGSASNVEVSRKYFISEAEIPRHFFLRWGGLQRRLDWKCASSNAVLVKHLKVISRSFFPDESS